MPSKKLWVKYTVFQGARERGSLGLSWFEIVLCRLLFNLDERVYDTERYKVIGWHGYLWYYKIKVSIILKIMLLDVPSPLRGTDINLSCFQKYLYDCHHKKHFIKEKW